MEHRQAQREPAEILVQLSTADGVTRKGRIKNLSSLGAGVVMVTGTLTRGTIVDIRLYPSEVRQRANRLHARGFVVRAQGSEFGLLWVTDDALAPIRHKSEQQEVDQANELLIA